MFGLHKYKYAGVSAALVSIVCMGFLCARRSTKEENRADGEWEDGGFIVESAERVNSVEVESHSRSVDEYALFSRTIDTFALRNTGDGVIKGVYVPKHEASFILYYDELGSIHKKMQHAGVHVLGFRYPLKPNERIAFTVETILAHSWLRSPRGKEKTRMCLKNKGVCSFAGEHAISPLVEKTYFYVWAIGGSKSF
ncbi:hypothetical protein NEMIN01_2304 [Nematocida minor]|uniref:uncharacterized protein n=1 Tax=Nematocida minor TaxID=1912983 RepID=UPI00221EA0C1|nr:uncharacterized protein NEMIN01_2304 [Nematocida minor]KAI5192944.1 hypothetical protein NEMIN01_2304 [Nematocida minor]